MLVKDLKEILSHIPDEYIVLMESHIGGQVVEWSNNKNITEITGYTLENIIEPVDYYSAEDETDYHGLRHIGGIVTLFNYFELGFD